MNEFFKPMLVALLIFVGTILLFSTFLVTITGWIKHLFYLEWEWYRDRYKETFKESSYNS